MAVVIADHCYYPSASPPIPRPRAKAALTARVLFVGDIHLGRRPGHLPEALQSCKWSESDLGPSAAWLIAVDHAVDEGVDAVVLAGDVVDCVEDRFEAAQQLEQGLTRLSEAKIPCFGVIGNHDVEALPRAADLVDGFELLGRDGCWERTRIPTRDGGYFDLVGWSFTSVREPNNPLSSLKSSVLEAGDHPCVGVLHCDLGAGHSNYAPVPRASFDSGAAAQVGAWFLGHIHKPSDLGSPRPVGYLGSLAGLDPGEPGPHGPWLVTLEGQASVKAQHVPLAPLRWERITVCTDGVEVNSRQQAEDELYRLLREASIDAVSNLGGRADSARALGLRVRVTGRSSDSRLWHQAIAAAAADSTRSPAREIDECFCFIEKLIDEVRPVHDLETLAKGSDPVALLARRILDIEQGTEEGVRLIHEATIRFERLNSSGQWGELDYNDREQLDYCALLLQAGYTNLEYLLEQASLDDGQVQR